MHKLINQSSRDFGCWKQCTECGAARHSGYWWFAGYKSKTEPPCALHSKRLEEWKGLAEEVELK